jgi:Heterokaryon incompatibility protein (HET)
MFSYSPLGIESSTIRLVKILPGLESSHVHCEVRHAPINDNYTCLSYAWGDSPECEIYVNGELFPVKRNLWEYLRHAREACVTQDLWIDAICVNQSSEEERADQVSIMGDIFRGARETVCWLGPSTNNTGPGTSFLSLLGTPQKEDRLRQEHGFFNTSDLPLPLTSEDVTVEVKVDFFDFTNPAWKGASSLVSRSWFKRLWVVQEVVVSKNLQFRFGSFTISGDLLFSAVELVSTIVTFPPRTILEDFHNAHELCLIRKRSLHLSEDELYLAAMMRRWDCADDRDRLYAIRNIVSPRSSLSSLSPNYRISTGNLYGTFARHYIMSTGKMDILQYAGDNRVYLRSTPGGCNFVTVSPTFQSCTWAPDWRIKTRPRPIHKNWEAKVHSRASSEGIYDFPSEQILRVRGQKLDEIAFVGPPLVNDAHEKLDFYSIFHIWLRIATDHSQESNDTIRRCAATLIGGAGYAKLAADMAVESPDDFLQSFEQWARRLFPHSALQTGSRAGRDEALQGDLHVRPVQDGIDVATGYGYKALDFCRYRSFFITTGGKFGLGPSQTSAAASIWLVRGLGNPLILEEAQQSGIFTFDENVTLKVSCMAVLELLVQLG